MLSFYDISVKYRKKYHSIDIPLALFFHTLLLNSGFRLVVSQVLIFFFFLIGKSLR